MPALPSRLDASVDRARVHSIRDFLRQLSLVDLYFWSRELSPPLAGVKECTRWPWSVNVLILQNGCSGGRVCASGQGYWLPVLVDMAKGLSTVSGFYSSQVIGIIGDAIPADLENQ